MFAWHLLEDVKDLWIVPGLNEKTMIPCTVNLLKFSINLQHFVKFTHTLWLMGWLSVLNLSVWWNIFVFEYPWVSWISNLKGWHKKGTVGRVSDSSSVSHEVKTHQKLPLFAQARILPSSLSTGWLHELIWARFTQAKNALSQTNENKLVYAKYWAGVMQYNVKQDCVYLCNLLSWIIKLN